MAHFGIADGTISVIEGACFHGGISYYSAYVIGRAKMSLGLAQMSQLDLLRRRQTSPQVIFTCFIHLNRDNITDIQILMSFVNE
jgi:hypothetical protein